MAVLTRELTKLIDRSSLTPTAVLPVLLRYRLIQWQQIMASGKQVESFDPFTSFAKKKKQNLNKKFENIHLTKERSIISIHIF